MQITEEMLKEAALIAVEYEYNNYVETKPHTFSADFLEKMDRMIETGGRVSFAIEQSEKLNKIRPFRKRKKRILLIVAILVIVNVTTILAYEPLRRKIGEIIATFYEDHFHFGKDDEDVDPQAPNSLDSFDPLKPDYVPEGFEMSDEIIDESSGTYLCDYTNEEGLYITYTQSDTRFGGMNVTADSGEMIEGTINGNTVYYFKDQDTISVFREEGYYIFVVTISESLGREVLDDVFESIK